MVGGNVNIDLFDFQEKAVINLIDLTTGDHKQVVTVKSPTGSGKTIILINYIDEYLSNVNKNTAFVWLCPGKGDLEEQSRQKMIKFAPTRNAQNLFDALTNGFTAESTTFINWELVTKTGNRAISDGERKNLFDRIAEAHRANIDFVIIIDEEHSNNTAKAQNIIDAIAAKHIIRMSATAIANKRHEFYEIDELDVINAGLITKALYVNEGIVDGEEISNDYDRLIDLADAKRKEIAKKYVDLGKTIRPLVLIQFPNGQPETIEAVENKLKTLGYTYDNGMVSKWMSGDKKDLPDNLTENDATPIFLLMKQAISTGWDCPRAKILVKLREGMSEQFEIQTIGRIRRMPERKHYEDDLLDFCFVYTYDETWKNGLLSSMDKAYETRRLFLKDKCKTFTLEKQLRNLDFSILGEREILNKVYDFLVKKYKFSTDKKQNIRVLQDAGYVIGNALVGSIVQGKYVKTETTVSENVQHISTSRVVNTHSHGIYLLHSTDALKNILGLSTAKTKVVLERLFRKGLNQNKKICNFKTDEFYAFVINNEKKLKEEFSEVTSDMARQMDMKVFSKTSTFHIPEQDFYKYDPTVKREVEFLSNAYKEYTSGFNTSKIRSLSEQLFEQYCEKKDDVDWVYKNGDTGQQYFSIVYVDAINKQWLFYADYIIKKKDGTVWIIETKGGESKGKNKNIDRQIANKFNAFKAYAEGKDIKWGFVRDLDSKLYINNTEFSLDMSDEHWVPLEEEF
ncbi:MAG: DEAD/DEAH box helicase family protein [Clostridia bacterium]|nr:DEAD/DEAH box helicase family protein [Clostridia bacterium]